jgi:hypothetical protein
MCLYFPRFVGNVADEERPEDLVSDRGAGKTVPVIDGEPAVRMVIAELKTALDETRLLILGPQGPFPRHTVLRKKNL